MHGMPQTIAQPMSPGVYIYINIENKQLHVYREFEWRENVMTFASSNTKFSQHRSLIQHN